MPISCPPGAVATPPAVKTLRPSPISYPASSLTAACLLGYSFSIAVVCAFLPSYHFCGIGEGKEVLRRASPFGSAKGQAPQRNQAGWSRAATGEYSTQEGRACNPFSCFHG